MARIARARAVRRRLRGGAPGSAWAEVDHVGEVSRRRYRWTATSRNMAGCPTGPGRPTAVAYSTTRQGRNATKSAVPGWPLRPETGWRQDRPRVAVGAENRAPRHAWPAPCQAAIARNRCPTATIKRGSRIPSA